MIESNKKEPEIVNPDTSQNLQKVKVELNRPTKSNQRRASKALQKQLEYNKGSFYDASQIALNNKKEISSNSLEPFSSDTLNLKAKGDKSLGGKEYNAAFPLPLSPFIKALAGTPSSSQDKKIIPWDNLKRDFVYRAINANLFGNLLTLEQIKQVLFYLNF